jgi:hypothetical protein
MGLIPLRLDSFNYLRDYVLDVNCESSNGLWKKIPNSALWYSTSGAATDTNHLLPGLRAECCEGYWESVPDFNLLCPVKTGITTHFDLQSRTRNEMVGMRFTGYFNAPYDGKYSFRMGFDDGSILFLRDPEVSITILGRTTMPAAESGIIGEAMDNLDEQIAELRAGRNLNSK